MIPDPLPLSRLSADARRAYDDFGYFVERYFGRRRTPWQIDAAEKVIEALETPELVFMVVNVAPGSGKSVTFTHDITCWATVRNRAIRGLIGSSSALLAGKPVARMRRTFERTRPIRATAKDLENGATDGMSTLAADFGRFKPVNDVWRADGFVVAQLRDEAITEKELTWSSYGLDSEQLGNRYDLVVWDDLVTFRNTNSPTANKQLKDWYDVEAESRPEPGGLFLLMGQRIGANDLYRHCLDKLDPVVLDEGMRRRMYRHVVYPAHSADVCMYLHDENRHGQKLKAWDPKAPQNGDCLLDPVRLPWRKLDGVNANRPDLFEVMYQQQDFDETSVLVQKRWIEGGVGEHGEILPGCLDKDRRCGQIPEGIAGPGVSFATIDPSVTGWWSVQWWMWYPEAGLDVLIDLHRAHMQAPDLLDWSITRNCHVGVMEEWQQRSIDMGHPIGTWIVEANAAHRYMLQYDHVRRWIGKHALNLIPHSTLRNKSDNERGLWTIRGLYQYGNVRLPWGDELTRSTITPMVEELTRYPAVDTDDTIMGHWFGHWQRPNLFHGIEAPPVLWRPSWAGETVYRPRAKEAV